MFDPQPIKALAIQTIEQTNAKDTKQTRPRANCIQAFLKGMPHMLPCIAVFLRRRVKTGLRHDDDKHKSYRHHADSAHKNRQTNIICANEDGKSHAKK